MAELGTPPMPWQQQVLDVAYELDEDSTEEASSAAGKYQPRLWYREPRVTVPRQSGKTQMAMARHVHRQQKGKVYGWHPRPTSIYLAQSASDARDKMVEEWFPILESSPFDKDAEPVDGMLLVKQYLRANGREAVKWEGGGRIITRPPNRTGGHGVSAVQLVDVDEAFAHRDDAPEQGMRPAMLTSICPQIWIVSTAGTADSEYLWGKVDDGRTRCQTGHFGKVAYFEWSALDDEDPADPATWYGCMPALGYTVREDTIAAEYDSMKLDEFLRAYLNRWIAAVSRIIPTASWLACKDPESQMSGRLWMAVDASPGQAGARSASIAVGGRTAAGRIHGEIVAHAEGMGWVPTGVVELQRRWPAIEEVYADPIGPIGAILPDIEQTSLRNVERIDARTMASACGRYLEDVMDATVAHLGQDVLDAAVDGAAKRILQDAWAWARRRSSADISPLVTVTLTHWASVIHPEAHGRIL